MEGIATEMDIDIALYAKILVNVNLFDLDTFMRVHDVSDNEMLYLYMLQERYPFILGTKNKEWGKVYELLLEFQNTIHDTAYNVFWTRNSNQLPDDQIKIFIETLLKMTLEYSAKNMREYLFEMDRCLIIQKDNIYRTNVLDQLYDLAVSRSHSNIIKYIEAYSKDVSDIKIETIALCGNIEIIEYFLQKEQISAKIQVLYDCFIKWNKLNLIKHIDEKYKNCILHHLSLKHIVREDKIELLRYFISRDKLHVKFGDKTIIFSSLRIQEEHVGHRIRNYLSNMKY